MIQFNSTSTYVFHLLIRSTERYGLFWQNLIRESKKQALSKG